MSQEPLNSSDIFSTAGILRHIFFESLSSSPTAVSSSSHTLSLPSSTYNDVSIETCINYVRSCIPAFLSNDALDKFRNLLNEAAPSGRINWKTFKPIAQHWITTIDLKTQDSNNNINELINDDTTSNPDGGGTQDGVNVYSDGSKFPEYVEWSVTPINRMDNVITFECDNSNVSIKSPVETDNAMRVELRLRIRQLNEDNTWLRDELERTEEMVAKYQRQYSTARQKFDRLSEKCDQLERENEEQKEMIATMEREEKRWITTLEKTEKERKSYVDKSEIQKQLILNLNAKIDKLKTEKKNFIKQLTTCQSKLREKDTMCNILQEKNDELIEKNKNLEEYYDKIIRNLQEQSEDLKNENIQLYSRMSSGHPSAELNLTSSMIYLNSSSESLPNDDFKIAPQNSLYEELKASGFSYDDDRDSAKIRELEEELEWYIAEIHNATKQLDELIERLEHETKLHDQQSLSDTSEYQTRHNSILLDKITLLSDAVTERFRKPSTNELGVQVSAQPLIDRLLSEFNILKFEECLSNKSIFQRKPASRDFSNLYFTIGPAVIENQGDVEILPKSIYTCTKRLNRRRWGRTFNSIGFGTPNRDAPINSYLSSSPHSSTAELESKISLRSAMNVDDNISRVNAAISPNTHEDKNISEKLYCESFSERLSLSPICGLSNMTERIGPKRKLSVFSRTYEVEKTFNTPQTLTERIKSSTPAPGDENLKSIFTSTAYRTGIDCSDSSDSLSMSKLHSSIEDTNCEDINREVSFSNEQPVFIAPPKLNLDIQNKTKELNTACPIRQDSSNLVTVNDSALPVITTDVDTSTNLHHNKIELIENSSSSCIDNMNNNLNNDSQATNSSSPIDNTQTSLSDINSMFQRVYDGCGKRVMSNKCIVGSPSVTVAMSSDEDSSDLSDNDATANCSVANGNTSVDNHNSVQDKLSTFDAIQSNINDVSCISSISSELNLSKSTMDINQELLKNKCEIVPVMKRSRSESECLASSNRDEFCCVCSIKRPKTNRNNKKLQLMVFPSLSDIQLHRAGIANLPNNDDFEAHNMAEDDLARKFTAFSLGLCSDRLTLLRRRALSIRQRDQIERNLYLELKNMQQNIQELAPLCFNNETIEKIERARHQVDIIAQCAHKVSCTAETLGAIQQEYRISRAINLADKYLRILRSKCEKLVIDLAETKRILMENNIIIDEHIGEYSEELTTLRYRGLPTNNRTMTAKRRASIATIFRPMIIGHDTVKDGIRQRNSVSGRVTFRRPSFSAESQRWETENLNRTESSNSVGELHEIFEQAESRRTSREENNNIMRHQVNICETNDTNVRMLEVWRDNVEEAIESEIDQESQQPYRRIFRLIFGSGGYTISWRSVIWCIIVSFFIGFYVKDAVSSGMCTRTPLKWWSIEEIFDRHVEVRNTAPRPI